MLDIAGGSSFSGHPCLSITMHRLECVPLVESSVSEGFKPCLNHLRPNKAAFVAETMSFEGRTDRLAFADKHDVNDAPLKPRQPRFQFMLQRTPLCSGKRVLIRETVSGPAKFSCLEDAKSDRAQLKVEQSPALPGCVLTLQSRSNRSPKGSAMQREDTRLKGRVW